jgi:glutamine synthetase
MLMAGLDGIQNKIMPPDPLDKDLYDLPPEDLARVQKTAGSLEEVLDALERDHDYLLKGDVFTKDVIDVWLSYKRTRELDAIRLRPHPWEFALYFDL